MDTRNRSTEERISDQALMLTENAIHIWNVDLDGLSMVMEDLEMNLSADERARAASIPCSIERQRFTGTRGVLRDVLGRYLQQRPEAISFSYGPFGKPQVDIPGCRISFNVTYADSLALIAVACDREVGIDAERINPCEDYEAIAARFLSPPEIQTLRAFPPTLRGDAFLATWTRKEACMKAFGSGMQLNLASFEVSFVPTQTVESSDSCGQRWSTFYFQPDPGYTAALAYPGMAPTLKFCNWLRFAPLPRATPLPGPKALIDRHAVDSESREEICL